MILNHIGSYVDGLVFTLFGQRKGWSKKSMKSELKRLLGFTQNDVLGLDIGSSSVRMVQLTRDKEGFAVVADEVRKLAERTAIATKEIAGMITQIQSDSRNAARELSDGIAEVDKGVALAGQAGKDLDTILELSRGVSKLVGEIASASGKQSEVSQELARTSDAIKTVSSQTADGLQEVARAVNDLNAQAERVQSMLDWFTLLAGSKGRNPGGGPAQGEAVTVRQNKEELEPAGT